MTNAKLKMHNAQLKTFLLLAAVVMLAGCVARSGKAVDAASALTIVSGGADTVRFGALREGEVGVRRLQLRNDSSGPLVVVRHEVSCGCVLVEYEREPLAAGETMPLVMRFDSRGAAGWQMKLLRLYVAGKEEPYRVFVEADVVQ